MNRGWVLPIPEHSASGGPLHRHRVLNTEQRCALVLSWATGWLWSNTLRAHWPCALRLPRITCSVRLYNRPMEVLYESGTH